MARVEVEGSGLSRARTINRAGRHTPHVAQVSTAGPPKSLGHRLDVQIALGRVQTDLSRTAYWTAERLARRAHIEALYTAGVTGWRTGTWSTLAGYWRPDGRR